jgi:ketosteroid isomerase-like protein
MPNRRDKGRHDVAIVDIDKRKSTAWAFLEGISAWDGPAIAAICTEDVEWWMGRSTAWMPGRGTMHGRDRILKHFQPPGPRWREGRTRWTEQHTLADGDIVVIHATRNSVTVFDAEYENEYVWMFRFEADKIAQLWEFVDSAYALRFFAPGRAMVMQKYQEAESEWGSG